MKYLFSALLMLAIYGAAAQNRPIVYGKVEGLPNTKLYLQADVKLVDSCASTNGSFRLELEKGTTPASCMVFYRNSKGAMEPLSPNFIAEKPLTTITAKFDDWKSYKIGNSEETRILHRMMKDLFENDLYIRRVNDSLIQNLSINKSKLAQAIAEYKAVVRKYAETYPRSFAVVEIISYAIVYASNDYEAMLNNELKSNPYAEKFRRFFALKKGIKVPLPVRDSCFVRVNLRSTLKRNTLLIAWFAGCVPCREELAYLETVDRSKLPFDIVTLSVDEDQKKWKGYLGKLRWNKRNYLWDLASARKTGIYKYPTSIMVDRNGVVLDPSFDVYSLGKE